MSPFYNRIVLDLQGVTLCILTPIVSLQPENRQSHGYCSTWGCAKIGERDKKMLVCSCCLDSQVHLGQNVGLGENRKVSSHTGFRSSVAVQLGCTGSSPSLQLNSGPGLVMPTGPFQSMALQAEARLLSWDQMQWIYFHSSHCPQKLVRPQPNQADGHVGNLEPIDPLTFTITKENVGSISYGFTHWWIKKHPSKPSRVISTLEMPSSIDCAKEIKPEYFLNDTKRTGKKNP